METLGACGELRGSHSLWMSEFSVHCCEQIPLGRLDSAHLWRIGHTPIGDNTSNCSFSHTETKHLQLFAIYQQVKFKTDKMSMKSTHGSEMTPPPPLTYFVPRFLTSFSQCSNPLAYRQVQNFTEVRKSDLCQQKFTVVHFRRWLKSCGTEFQDAMH